MGSSDSKVFSPVGRSSMRNGSKSLSMTGLVKGPGSPALKPKDKLQLDRFWIGSKFEKLSHPGIARSGSVVHMGHVLLLVCRQ